MKKLIETEKLEKALDEFAKARDWERCHSPKNLAMALTGEVGELVEIFQWLTEEESLKAAKTSQGYEAVRDEIADVMIYLVRLAHVLGVDINAAVAEKMEKNSLKYPAK